VRGAQIAMIEFLRSHFADARNAAIDTLLQHLGNERIDPDQRGIHVDYLKSVTGRYFPPNRGVVT
jgi:hypothetical protein